MSPKEGGPLVVRNKRKRVSKKNKAAWRKHSDTKDVDVFLNDARHEERVGVKFDSVESNVLFYEDLLPSSSDKSEPWVDRKLKGKETILKGPKCWEILESRTRVPVPVKTRDKSVKTRPNPGIQEILDKKKDTKNLKGQENKYKHIRKLKRKKKIDKSGKDVWGQKEKTHSEWLRKETVVNLMKGTGTMKPAVPSSVLKKTSSICAVEPPHPGTSYNPSYFDHQHLLTTIGVKEMGLLKTEQHLARVTSNMFSMVNPQKAANDMLKEMSQGLPFSDEIIIKEEDDGTEFSAVNPPALDKKKTKKTRKNINLAKKEAYERKLKAIEKKKVADIYKLKNIKENIQNTELKSSKRQEIRKEKKNEKALKTKRISKVKFEEYETEFKMPYEIDGNLRNMKPGGSILLERFKSLQKRNILEPTQFQKSRKRAKKKVFVRSSHKIEKNR